MTANEFTYFLLAQDKEGTIRQVLCTQEEMLLMLEYRLHAKGKNVQLIKEPIEGLTIDVKNDKK
jgi:hypothetical protein